MDTIYLPAIKLIIQFVDSADIGCGVMMINAIGLKPINCRIFEIHLDIGLLKTGEYVFLFFQ